MTSPVLVKKRKRTEQPPPVEESTDDSSDSDDSASSEADNSVGQGEDRNEIVKESGDDDALNDTKRVNADLLLDQWVWGDMRFTDVLVPDLCFYVRICRKTSKLILAEKFVDSWKVLKVLDLEKLKNATYVLQESLKHIGVDQSEAYVYLKPLKGYQKLLETITLKFPKDRDPQKYDFLLTTIRAKLDC